MKEVIMNTYASFKKSIRRITLLVKLQISQKYKHATGLKQLIFSLMIKFGIAAVIVYALNFLMGYTNFISGITYNENILSLILLVFLAISVISALSSTITQIFKSTDNEFLFSLHTRPEEVFISKILIVLSKEVISSLFMVLPILIGYGIGMGNAILSSVTIVDTSYYVAITGFAIVMPLITVSLAILISIPINYMMEYIRKNLILKLVFYGLLFSVIFLGFIYVLNNFIDNLNFITNLRLIALKLEVFAYNFSDKIAVIKEISKYIIAGNFGCVMLLLLTGVVLSIIAYLVIKPIYFSIVINSRSSSYKKGKGINKYHSPYSAIIKKDLHILFDNGGDFTKYFLLAVVVPFFLIIVNKIFSINEISIMGQYMVVAINIMIMTIFTCMNCSYVASALTAEGQNFYLFKTTPSQVSCQLSSKLIINFVVNLFSILGCCVVLFIMGIFPKIYILLIFITVVLANVGHLCGALYSELKAPLLDWYDETEINDHKNVSDYIIKGLLGGIVIGIFAIKFFNISPDRAPYEIIALVLIYASTKLWALIKRYNFLLKQIGK